MKAIVLGHGVMGKHHARILRRLGLQVETIDPDPAAGADRLKATPLPEADIACIATPPGQLASAAIEALSWQLDVLIEKPMAADLEQARQILQAERSSGCKVRVGYLERWNPAVSLLKEAMPLLGPLHHVFVQRLGRRPRCSSFTPSLDLLTHDIDVLRFLELEPRLLHSSTGDASVSATFALSQGHATLLASHVHPRKMRTLTAVGEEGALHLDYQRQTLVFDDGTERELEVCRLEPLELQWRAFLAGDGVRVEDAFETLDLALLASKGGRSPIGPSHCIAQ